MTLDDMQEAVDDYISQFEAGYWEPLALVTHLTEELGELAREVNNEAGVKKRKDSEGTENLRGEIGDVLFTLTCLANAMDISLDKAFRQTMEKYGTRDADRWERKDD